MTRIIAGDARGAAIAVPPSGTRPTSDRVREALFSALESRIGLDGADVLDLYAGSGALGLEAASRGAANTVFVERAPRAAKLLRANVGAVRDRLGPTRLRATRFDVATQSVRAFLERDTGRYDIVFADPPYDLDGDEVDVVLEGLVDRLRPVGTIVFERSSRSPEPSVPDGLVLDRAKRYGETVLYFYEPRVPDEQPTAPLQGLPFGVR
ncbi:16S rRNA (guanine(966)-N(2))-methyltransferase RsmD [Pseudoclavibacter chungangensis]|uniref:16S rRNA (Guanine(966)-N(2))-methyltransferase RsmD n=1 Tax=Pseudoclavibacter chungangensis TaxID=587635 RepID=A0A7J5BZ59_9MICO|nr:16S rRNA (guanine(966)-N(2))-methyltransferase RsmD [Pseudoclavibacter chungangensis]KAB1659636.1 16S rRNA (guanine(966)-N(2))-methyltransferase RsmD [Pseudoclavibacter chungangensis]NYJ67471.1 16S rRNA (guanine966-N2)-methyltransferase [Pseudoclavibacter chungangensis]